MYTKMISMSLCFAICQSLALVSSTARTAEAVIQLPPNVSVPAVFVFGDSIVDTGNNNYIKTVAKCNFPPYGQDFMGGQATGRFSNGKVPADLLVEELGIKPTLPPYLDPSLTDEDLLTGVNFASGAAGYDPLTSQLSTIISLTDQLKLFKEYIEKIKKIVGEEKAMKIVSEAIVALVVGSNDITNTYFLLPFRQAHYDVPSYVDLLLSYASTFVQGLYKAGARRIGVFSLPPMGCLPSQRTLRGGPERKCVDEYNQVGEYFNQKLIDKLTSLNTGLPDARLVYIDIFNLPLDIIRNPEKYGFKISDRGCCGTGTIEVTLICRHACPNVMDYVFWDSFHPTEKAYRILVQQLLSRCINNFLSDQSTC